MVESVYKEIAVQELEKRMLSPYPRRFWAFVVFCLVLHQPSNAALSSHIKALDLLQRHRRDTKSADRSIGCIEMTGDPGEYWFTSTGSDEVCGLYLIADVDKLVEFEILEFDIDCEGGGLFTVVDGWELQGQLFPSSTEIQGGFDAQYQTFCGSDAPAHLYTASQNVALLQFRVPRAGQGFRVRVRLIQNFQPCNALAPFEATVFSIKNFGFRRNCTVQIVFPVNVLLLSANIGVASETGSVRTRRNRLSVNCAGPAGADYASLSFGQGLDTSDFDSLMAFCGSRSKPARRSMTLGCGNSAVSLHSSGFFFNSLRFEVSTPTQEELDAFVLAHPQCGSTFL